VPNPILNNQILQFTVYTFNATQVWINSVWSRVTGVVAGVPTDLDAATAIDAVLAPLYKVVLSTSNDYRGVGCRILATNPPLPMAGFAGNAGPGTSAFPSLPTQVRGLIKFTTNAAGRAWRGRNFLPPPSTTFSTAAGIPTAAYLIAAGPIAALWGSGVLTSTNAGRSFTHQPSIYHRPVPGHPKPQDGTTTPITTALLEALWATQRRGGDLGRTNVLPF
jgi:hypothetical protein